jgi:hypothetical protein
MPPALSPSGGAEIGFGADMTGMSKKSKKVMKKKKKKKKGPPSQLGNNEEFDQTIGDFR